MLTFRRCCDSVAVKSCDAVWAHLGASRIAASICALWDAGERMPGESGRATAAVDQPLYTCAGRLSDPTKVVEHA